MPAREDDSSRNGGVEAFLAAARAVLERLQAPATRAEARRLLGAVRRRLADDPAAGQEERFRAFNLRIHDVVLQGRPPILPTACQIARITRRRLEGCCDEEDDRKAAMERLRILEDCVVVAYDGFEHINHFQSNLLCSTAPPPLPHHWKLPRYISLWLQN
ncbi:uncharacterized protein LOC119280173 [Triticum dicoccoides]|uniref:uncharacterized protein LOC119280173 n=1 Tax=Triticum dicoccoides TaxID=85692 RepID=UPI00188F5CED|nr:uncharacterized protein LOC119280173 [Triticum dicoccoides]